MGLIVSTGWIVGVGAILITETGEALSWRTLFANSLSNTWYITWAFQAWLQRMSMPGGISRMRIPKRYSPITRAVLNHQIAVTETHVWKILGTKEIIELQ